MAFLDSVMERLFKVVIVGDVEVGKTSFIRKYAFNRDTITEYKCTIGGKLIHLIILCGHTHDVHFMVSYASRRVQYVVRKLQVITFDIQL